MHFSLTDSEILKYLLLPYGHREGEINCYGLVQRLYKDFLQISLPSIQISLDDLMKVSKKISHERSTEVWEHVPAPYPESLKDFDVILMGRGKVVHHVGVFLYLKEGPNVLHAFEVIKGVALVPFHRLTVRYNFNTIEAIRYAAKI